MNAQPVTGVDATIRAAQFKRYLQYERRRGRMLPSREQWRRWSLPSKYTALGFLLGAVFGVAGSGLSFYFWLNPRSPVEPIALPPPIFRSAPVLELAAEDVREMIKKNGFFDSGASRTPWANPEADGFSNRFEIKENGRIVVDYASGLVWDTNGSNEMMYYADAQKYIEMFNKSNSSGHSDWRLPTIEEAMSLMDKKANGVPPMHIDTVFNRQPWAMWTSDKQDSEHMWVTYFLRGECYPTKDGYWGWVRAVR